jgi:hypothetical protein
MGPDSPLENDQEKECALRTPGIPGHYPLGEIVVLSQLPTCAKHAKIAVGILIVGHSGDFFLKINFCQ